VVKILAQNLVKTNPLQVKILVQQQRILAQIQAKTKQSFVVDEV
jgi:hypothetical protein